MVVDSLPQCGLAAVTVGEELRCHYSCPHPTG